MTRGVPRRPAPPRRLPHDAARFALPSLPDVLARRIRRGGRVRLPAMSGRTSEARRPGGEARAAEASPAPQASPRAVSVVIATYNRAASTLRLLGELAAQTLSPADYEVVVVDDGSREPGRARIEGLALPYRVTVIEQANAGPAAARHRGIEQARGDIVVIVDDDMRLQPGFLEAHLRAHPPGTRRVALGPFENETRQRLAAHERMGTRSVNGIFAGVRSGQLRLRGTNLYTGNVSFRRDDYLAVGGFDPAFRISEDAELGVRLERAGVEITMAEDAVTVHASDHADLAKWVQRSIAYGGADSRMAEKHPGDPATSPWRFVWQVRAFSRPFLLLSAFHPTLMRPVTWLALLAVRVFDALRFDRLAEVGVTFAYGLLYYRGVREHAGSRRAVRRSLHGYLNLAAPRELGFFGKWAKMWADIRADHDAIRRADEKYRGIVTTSRLSFDLVRRIGLQMMAAYRAMRFFRTAGLTPFAMIQARLIRHLYGADIHWDAELAPGVMVVHGVGLVIAPGTRVGRGCVLFQHVTLGQSIHPETRQTGVPTLEADVHVGPGAVLLGPITVGAGTKITANALVMHSVPPQSLVEVAAATVRTRQGGRPPAGQA